MLKRAGVQRIRFYDLRHSCATLLFAQRVASSDDRGSARAQLAIYVDVLRKAQRDAVDRLGHLFGPYDESDT
ncbi:MAG: site-specific integrase [Pseudonocardiales bacterium]|jgi:integrase|nr:site-specific integrase [Pseudonocardiales bacterium]